MILTPSFDRIHQLQGGVADETSEDCASLQTSTLEILLAICH